MEKLILILTVLTIDLNSLQLIKKNNWGVKSFIENFKLYIKLYPIVWRPEKDRK